MGFVECFPDNIQSEIIDKEVAERVKRKGIKLEVGKMENEDNSGEKFKNLSVEIDTSLKVEELDEEK